MHFAAAMGKAQLVQRLLAAGGEVDLADKEGKQRCQQCHGWASWFWLRTSLWAAWARQ